MDIIKHYSAYPQLKASASCQAGASRLDGRYTSLDEFVRQMEAERGEPIAPTDRSKFLYNGSETRAHLSDTEIAVLANKYDVHDMDQETYDAFLDDLQSMGAISSFEKQQLGYKGIVPSDLGNTQNLTMYAWSAATVPGESAPIFHRWEAEGDISRWINDRIQWQLGRHNGSPERQKELEDQEKLYKALAGYINRMEARQEEDAEAAEKAGLRRQIMDSESDFYTGMLNKMQAQVEKTRDDKEQQAIVDALGEVLDALSGKKDVTGEKASVNKTASDLTAKMGERIARLKQEDPEHPEAVKLEQMLKRLQELGIYFDLSDTDDIFTEEEDSFETLTQLLTRRQREEAISDTPQTERGEQQQ
jgi:hypothetical protein